MKKSIRALVTAGLTAAAVCSVCSVMALADDYSINPIDSTGGPTITNSATIVSENGKSVNITTDKPATTLVTNTNLKVKKELIGQHSETPGNPDDIRAGDEVQYKITVFNDGDHTAVNVKVEDILSNMTYKSATPTGNGITLDTPGTGNKVAWTIASIAENQHTELTVTAVLNAGLAKGLTIKNGANVISENGQSINISTESYAANPSTHDANKTADTDGGTAESGEYVKPEFTIKEPDLEVAKVVDRSAARRDDQITYTITVTNNGDGTARNVKVQDDLDTANVSIPEEASFKTTANTAGAAVTHTVTNETGLIDFNIDKVPPTKSVSFQFTVTIISPLTPAA